MRLSELQKKIVFVFVPAFCLLLLGELACRVKFYIDYSYDVKYLVAPFMFQEKKERTLTKIPCYRDSLLYSPCQDKMLPRTVNEYGWRGPLIPEDKDEDIFRIFAVGGSSVAANGNSDVDTWVHRVGQSLDDNLKGNKRFQVVNAGVSGYDSFLILRQIQEKILKMHPDMIIYYESINDARLIRNIVNRLDHVNYNVALFANSIFGRIHNVLNYKSLMYTYLTEKYHSILMDKQTKFENIIPPHFSKVVELCQDEGIELVYVKQALRFPMVVDNADVTYDKDNLVRTITYLRNNPDSLSNYVPEVPDRSHMIQLLLQRLINKYQADYCRDKGLFVIDPLPEIDKVMKNGTDLFIDYVHKTCYGDLVLADVVSSELIGFFQNKFSFSVVEPDRVETNKD